MKISRLNCLCKGIFFILIVLSALSSCIQTIPLESVEVNKILVVNSLITPDSLFSCEVTRVFPINDTANHNVENATVSVYEAESEKPVCRLMHQSNGRYVGNVKPAIGIRYRIEVEADGYPKVTGETIVPNKPVINNVSFARNMGWDPLLNWSYCELKFNVEDNETFNDFYEVIFSAFRKSNTDTYTNEGSTTKIQLEDSIYTIQDIFGFADYTIVDPVINAEGLMQYNPSTLVFSDQLFNGATHYFNVRSYDVNGKAYVFCSYSLSEELYKNRISFMQHLYERGAKGISRFDDMAGLDFTSKAVDTYSNLTGGYGIFAGYNTTLLFSKLGEHNYIEINQTKNPYD